MKFSTEQWNEEKRKWIESDSQIKFEKTKSGGYRYGVCPGCGETELWIGSGLGEAKCNRSSCGFSKDITDLYPGIIEALRDRFKIKSSDPLAAAKNYMQFQRGLDIKQFDGWFSQARAKCKSDDQSYNTVRFVIDEKAKVYWERFIDCHQKHKANFIGSYKGKAWTPPKRRLKKGMEAWICEGILNSMSLVQNGIYSLATLSTNNLPTEFIEKYQGKEIKWVVAYDNDPVNTKTGKNAGLEATKKLVRYLKELGESVTVAFPPLSKDWNDLHKAGTLESDRWTRDAKYLGRLLTAENHVSYGEILAERKRAESFVFDFKNQIYCYELKMDNKGEIDVVCYAVSNFTLKLLYVQYDHMNKMNTFYFQFSFSNGNKIKNVELLASEIKDNATFGRKILEKTGSGNWTGAPRHLQHLNKRWFKVHPKTINITQILGYHEDSDAYIFNDFAYEKSGKLVLANESDYCDIPDFGGLRTTFESKENEEIRYYPPKDDFPWVPDLLTAYGGNGLAALSFFTLSLFAEQIYQITKAFPFFSAIGEPGSGKTTLINFLWKLLGRIDYEGVPMSGRITDKAVGRTTARASNLPTVYIEANNIKHSFDFESMLPWINRRPIGGGATKDYTLNTHTLPFRTTIMIAQNKPIEGTPALRERFVNTHYDQTHFSDKGRVAGDRLKGYHAEDISSFLHEVLSNRNSYIDKIMKAYDKTEVLFRDEKLKNPRIIDFHALIHGGIEVLGERLVNNWQATFKHKALTFMLDLARKQEQQLSYESEMVANFFEDVADFIIQGEEINHSSIPDEYALCLQDIFKLQTNHGNRPADISTLKKELKHSPRYIKHRVSIRSSYDKTKVKSCWIFRKGSELDVQEYEGNKNTNGAKNDGRS